MNRKVVIIGSPLISQPKAFEDGVYTDAQNYYNFFISPTGGAYIDGEITYLENPTLYNLKETLAKLPAEHITIVFSGHGGTGKISKKTLLDINSNEKVSIKEITSFVFSPRLLIVADSCRSYIQDDWSGFGDLESIDRSIQFPSYLSLQKARRIFDNALRKTPAGVQILYSCAIGEKSIITSSGSHFSQSLLLSIKKWSLKIEDKSVLLVNGAHRLSTNFIKRLNKTQNPQTFRFNNVNYPFALRLGSELI